MSKVSDALSFFTARRTSFQLYLPREFLTPFTFSQIDYSEKYQDGKYEYRHVILTKEMAKNLPKNRTLSETEWRGIGVQQSRGWDHYACHRPEPHILLFRRPLGTVSLAEALICMVMSESVKRVIWLDASGTFYPASDCYSMILSKQI